MLDSFQEIEIESQILTGRFTNPNLFTVAFQIEVCVGYIQGQNKEVDPVKVEKFSKLLKIGNKGKRGFSLT